MLEYLRDMSGKPVAKVLVGILMFSFVGWGVAEWIFRNTAGDSTLIKVGDEDITVGQFNLERSNELSRLPREQQRKIYADSEKAKEFFSEVLTDMTNNTMIRNRAKDLGFFVTDKRVLHEIREVSDFQENGRFSPALMDVFLSRSGMTEKQLAEYIRGQVLRSMVLSPVMAPMPVPEFAVLAAYNARYSERQIEYSEVKFNDFKTGNPTDEQLREFYAKNPKTIPETRTVSYVLVPAQMDKPDSYDAGYTKAQKLEDSIISGESMSSAAAKNKAKYVYLQAFSRDKRPTDAILTDSMISKIFAMEQGMESEIIETKQGFVIIRVEDVKVAHTADFDSVKTGLVDGWKKEEQKKQAYLQANDLLVSLNKGQGLRAKKTAKISRTYGAPTDVLISSFANKVGSNSIVPGTDAFYVLRVEKEFAPKLDTVKMAALRKELQNIASRSVIDDYKAFLMREYPVKVNKRAFEKIFAK